MIGAGSGALVIAGSVSLAAGPSAGATPSPGVGSSYAQSFQDTPHDGSLAVGVVLGEALAGHTNYVARAQSQGLDLGSIGLSLQSYNCGSAPSAEQTALVPQPLQAETGQAGAAQGETETASTGASSAGPTDIPPTFGSTEFVQATGTPYGEADTTYGPIDAGVYTVSGMASKAWSGLVSGQREAGATSDIKSISLVDSAVVLKDLHWQVLFPSGGSAQPTGSFSIGQLLIDGTGVAAPNSSALASAANTVLGTLGIELIAPTVSKVQGVETVSPLEIEVVPNTTRDSILNAVLGPLGKAEYPIANGLENGFSPSEPSGLTAELCQSDTPITVADVVIAGIDGAGYYSTAFGGVNATSGAAPVNSFNLALPGSSSAGSTQYVAGSPGVAGVPGVAGTSVGGQSVAPDTSASPDASTISPTGSAAGLGAAAPTENIAAVGHAKGGPLLAIGLGGLGLLGLLAEGDRRIMRRAQRSVNFDNFEE